MILVKRELPLDWLAISRDTYNRDREKSSSQAILFNISIFEPYEQWTEPQLNLR
jgi:hypothetical protein